MQICFVTHLYEFSRELFDQADSRFRFLRAETDRDGRRSFQLVPGEPLPTSHGADVYQRVFGQPLRS